LAARGREPVPAPGTGATVPAEVQQFVSRSDRQVVVYWTQEGRRVWTDEDEARDSGRDVLDGANFAIARALLPTRDAVEPRLTVVVATPTGGPGAQADALELAGLLAGEIFRLCPWAEPAPAVSPPSGGPAAAVGGRGPGR
jgi:hypothetical protein